MNDKASQKYRVFMLKTIFNFIVDIEREGIKTLAEFKDYIEKEIFKYE